MKYNLTQKIISEAFFSLMVVVPTIVSSIQAQNSTNSSSSGGNIANSTSTNITVTLNNPTASNTPGMSQVQGGPIPNR